MTMAEHLRRIRAVEAKPGHRLTVTWDTGALMAIDLSPLIQRGGVFAPLGDERLFMAVRVGERQRVLEWPKPSDNLGYPLIEMDADALFAMGIAQRNAGNLARLSGLLSRVLGKTPHPA